MLARNHYPLKIIMFYENEPVFFIFKKLKADLIPAVHLPAIHPTVTSNLVRGCAN